MFMSRVRAGALRVPWNRVTVDGELPCGTQQLLGLGPRSSVRAMFLTAQPFPHPLPGSVVAWEQGYHSEKRESDNLCRSGWQSLW